MCVSISEHELTAMSREVTYTYRYTRLWMLKIFHSRVQSKLPWIHRNSSIGHAGGTVVPWAFLGRGIVWYGIAARGNTPENWDIYRRRGLSSVNSKHPFVLKWDRTGMNRFYLKSRYKERCWTFSIYRGIHYFSVELCIFLHELCCKSAMN